MNTFNSDCFRKCVVLIGVSLLSGASLVRAQNADKDKQPQPPPAQLPASQASPDPNKNFPNNPNINPTPGQKYNAKGVAGSMGESGAGKSPLERADQTFLTDTFEHTAEQYKIAKLAASKAVNPDVKAFAEKRVKAYEQLTSKLDAINKDKHMGLVAAKSENAFESLNKKSGGDFDEAYLKYDRAEMKHAIERAQKTAEKGKDDAVKALAAKLIPQYQENERFASELELALKKK